MMVGGKCLAFHVVILGGIAFTSASRTRAKTGIINGTNVGQSSPLRTMFALPTNDAGSDDWLGCGASIISPTFGLTSAHCFGGGLNPCSGPLSIALWIGDIELSAKGMQSVVVPRGKRAFRVEADVMCSPEFNGKCSNGNDVALLKLRKKLPSWVTPVRLDLDGKAAGKVGDVVTPMGFGMVEDANAPTAVSYDNAKFLRKADVTVLAQDAENCARVYAGGYGCSDEASEGPAANLDMQLCAGTVSGVDHDACAGDSGSPVVDKNGIQVGLVSYGGGPGEKMTGPGRMCGDPDYPGVYARVSTFHDFIRKTVHDLPGSSTMISLAENQPDFQLAPVFRHLRG